MFILNLSQECVCLVLNVLKEEEKALELVHQDLEHVAASSTSLTHK